jgi:hypothetical protein
MQATTPLINNLTPTTGRMVNEENEIHNVVDPFGSLKIVGIEHSSVHAAQSFAYTTTATIPAGQSGYFLGRTGTTTAHMNDFFIHSDQAPMTIQFFESPTVTSIGTAQTTMNRNRQALNVATLTVYANPTISADGTRLFVDQLLGTQKDVSGENLVGEWLLKKSTDYIFKITNSSSQSAQIVAGFNWIEQD